MKIFALYSTLVSLSSLLSAGSEFEDPVVLLAVLLATEDDVPGSSLISSLMSGLTSTVDGRLGVEGAVVGVGVGGGCTGPPGVKKVQTEDTDFFFKNQYTFYSLFLS